MRMIDPELQRRLVAGATTLCRCWRVRRRDGRAFGFTDHDQDLTFDGTTFSASTGVNGSAIQATSGLAVDNAQILGALSSAHVTEQEVRGGRFDGAAVDQWLVDWTDTELRLRQFSGHFGEIRQLDGRFEVELRGLTDRLNAPVGRALIRTCDRALGDAKCRFDLSTPGFSCEAEVRKVVSPSSVELAVAEEFAPGWFESGALSWLSGGNQSDTSWIKIDRPTGSGVRTFDLWNEPGMAVSVGDRVRAVAGCDKSLETCRDKFSNLFNFRGFPHIPGDDWVAAYPKEGEVHDGASLGTR